MRADRRGDNTASLAVEVLTPSEGGDTTVDDLEAVNGGNSLASLLSTKACRRPIFGSVFRRISVVQSLDVEAVDPSPPEDFFVYGRRPNS